MTSGGWIGLRQWVARRCAGRRLRSGTRQRAQLLQRVGRTGAAAVGYRLPSCTWRAHGEATYRRFKWDPASVPTEVRALCRRLQALEAHLSALARQMGAVSQPAGAPRRIPPSPAATWRIAGTA